MFEKINTYAKYFIHRSTDIRFIGQVVFVVIVLLVSWSTVQAIQDNYKLQKQVSEMQQENDVQRLKNDNLRIKNKYLETDEFLELAARRQFGKAAPGEKIIVVPKSTAMSFTKDISVPTRQSAAENAEASKPFYQRNLEAWGRFFFPSSSSWAGCFLAPMVWESAPIAGL